MEIITLVQRHWNIMHSVTYKKVEPIIFFSGPDSETCTTQSSFAGHLNEEYSIKLNYCGVFIVPQTSIGNFLRLVLQGTGKNTTSGTNITTIMYIIMLLSKW
jgi:hypothetical protein